MRPKASREAIHNEDRRSPVPTTRVNELDGLHYKHSLVSLLDLTHDLSAKRDLYSIADIAVANLMGHVGTTRVALWIFSDEANRRDPVLLRSQGLAKPIGDALGGALSPELIDRLDESGRPVLEPELSGYLSSSGVALVRDTRIQLIAPLLTRGQFLGLVALGEAKGLNGYSPGVLEILRASLSIIGTALDNAWRHSRVLEEKRQLKSSFDELQDLDRLKSDFLSTLDHELRTPLTLLITYLDVLKTSGTWNVQQEGWMEILSEQVNKLNSLILTLLDWKSLKDDSGEIELETGAIGEVVSQFYDERRPGISAELRKISISIDPDVPPVCFNAVRVRQILDVVVGNAQKFTPPGTNIDLKVQTEVDESGMPIRVRVDVVDDGPGIPEDRLSSVFESFRQVESTLTRQHGGIGMGLAVAQKIAERMNGTLDVDSELGKGSRFSLRLPVAARAVA